MKDYYEVGPLGIAHYWYDRGTRVWIVTRRALPSPGEPYGDQIGGALYEATKKAAQKTAGDMVSEVAA
jgi:hypothetical protein